MLAAYYDAVDSVPASERNLLDGMLADLEACLEPGISVLNWNSLGIPEFAARARRAINEFATRVSQVLKHKHDIEASVAEIANACLLPPAMPDYVPTLQVRNPRRDH